MYLHAKNILRGLKVIGFSQTEYKQTGKLLYKTIKLQGNLIFRNFTSGIVNKCMYLSYSETQELSNVFFFLLLFYLEPWKHFFDEEYKLITP